MSEGVKTVAVPASVKKRLEGLVNRTLDLGARVPARWRGAAAGMGPATYGGVVSMACAMLEAAVGRWELGEFTDDDAAPESVAAADDGEDAE